MARRFGQQTQAELNEAHTVAKQVVAIYGDFTAEEHARFMAQPWNDHPSVQAALVVIMDRNDNYTKGHPRRGR